MLNSNNLQRRKEHSTIKGIEPRLMTGNVAQKWLQQRHHIVFMILAITYSPLHFLVPLMCCVFGFCCVSVWSHSMCRHVIRGHGTWQKDWFMSNRNASPCSHLTAFNPGTICSLSPHIHKERPCDAFVIYNVAYCFNQLQCVIILVLLNLALLLFFVYPWKYWKTLSRPGHFFFFYCKLTFLFSE